MLVREMQVDMFTFLIKGVFLGFSIAAPVGPIGVLCIRRALTQGALSGFVSGLGAATADGIYGSIAGLGLTVVSTFLVSQQLWFRLIGGLFLLYLGIKTLLSRPAEKAAKAKNQGLLGDYLSTLLLTITNPLTILSFAAIFAGLGAGTTRGNERDILLLIVGVFLGSALWWLLLSSSMHLFSKKISLTSFVWINRISGLIIVLFGFFALFTART